MHLVDSLRSLTLALLSLLCVVRPAECVGSADLAWQCKAGLWLLPDLTTHLFVSLWCNASKHTKDPSLALKTLASDDKQDSLFRPSINPEWM